MSIRCRMRCIVFIYEDCGPDHDIKTRRVIKMSLLVLRHWTVKQCGDEDMIIRRLQRKHKEFVDDQGKTGESRKTIELKVFWKKIFFCNNHDLKPTALVSARGPIKRPREEEEYVNQKKVKYQRKRQNMSDVLRDYTS